MLKDYLGSYKNILTDNFRELLELIGNIYCIYNVKHIIYIGTNFLKTLNGPRFISNTSGDIVMHGEAIINFHFKHLNIVSSAMLNS